ncbi:hypothetical protein GA0070563_108101 [Micromonospora carbonacea]|uniref:Uncharacterized protein n=1 Tax=Micromonospora carbonacea TaxID=47853 RepID=A0A1C4ZET1_9ACTN|nr:hypothetical protein GA0070563_108101 [Micromonospora carbonacea]
MSVSSRGRPSSAITWLLAIFVVMFVDEGESARAVSGKATGRPSDCGGRIGGPW